MYEINPWKKKSMEKDRVMEGGRKQGEQESF